MSRTSGAKLRRPVTAGCIARAVLEQRKVPDARTPHAGLTLIWPFHNTVGVVVSFCL